MEIIVYLPKMTASEVPSVIPKTPQPEPLSHTYPLEILMRLA